MEKLLKHTRYEDTEVIRDHPDRENLEEALQIAKKMCDQVGIFVTACIFSNGNSYTYPNNVNLANIVPFSMIFTYMFVLQVNEGMRHKENSERLEWLQIHVDCQSLGNIFITPVFDIFLKTT